MIDTPRNIGDAVVWIHGDNHYDYVSDYEAEGSLKYINATTLAADPIAVLGKDALIKAVVDAAPDLVWVGCILHSDEEVSGEYVIIEYKTFDGFTEWELTYRENCIAIYYDSDSAKDDANTHHHVALTKALGG